MFKFLLASGTRFRLKSSDNLSRDYALDLYCFHQAAAWTKHGHKLLGDFPREAIISWRSSSAELVVEPNSSFVSLLH